MSLPGIEGVKLGAAIALAATVVLGSSAQAAAAAAPAFMSVSLYDLGIVYASGSYSGVSQSGGSESASLTGFPQPTLTALASGDVDGMRSGAGAYLAYYYEVVGPQSDTPVDLQITGALSISSTINGSARAFISTGHMSKLLSISGQGDDQASPSWFVSVTPGIMNLIEMRVSAGGADFDGAYSAYAFADPIISFVGPHDGYSLAFSPGIGNGGGGGVPEPATWAMMLTGFGLAGMALRRRRLVVTA
jgi:hypothetical protein